MSKSLMLHLTIASLVMAPVAAAAAPDAAKFAARAEKLLAKKKLDKAVIEAESAVEAAPQDAGYRMLLGKTYLESGRFRAAAASFADALSLDPARGNAALSLVLARLGLGDTDSARTVLATHGALIAPGDRGLALTLSGDAPAGVSLLEETVRGGGADAKTRQNLALSYALAGRWAEAKLMASYDLDPATLSQRIMSWSQLAREGQSATQVAALLGVQPGDDAGQPIRLALNAPSAPVVQLAEAAPPPPPPAAMDEPVLAPPTITFAAAPVAPVLPISLIQFAPRAEIVQPIATKPARIATAPKPAAPRLVQPTGGRFVVQLGAFDSMGVAEDAWDRAVTRIGALRGFTPSTATFVQGSATFHRLSVGGFGTRAAAADFCETLRTRGARCFVRESAGDAPLQWAKRTSPTQLAAR